MIFINKNADYSSVAIGKVDIEVEFEPETISILSNYSKDIAKSTQNSFNEFIYFLKKKGWYSHLSALSIPLFAANVQEATKNIVNGKDSTYDPSVHTNVTVEEYGLNVAVRSDSTAMPMTEFVDSINKTLACLWYQKNSQKNCTGICGRDFYAGANEYVQAPNVKGKFSSGKAGINEFNSVCSTNRGTTYDISTFSRSFNGDLDTLSGTSTDSIALVNRYCIGASSKADGATFCAHNANVSMFLVLNIGMTAEEAQELDNEIKKVAL